MDLLGDVLAISSVRGSLGRVIEAGEDWGWWAAPEPGFAAIHAVTSGVAWLGMAGCDAVRLLPGDVVLLPAGDAHVLASDPAALARTDERSFESWSPTPGGGIRIGGGMVQAHILCAHYSHDPAVNTQVLNQLPELLHLRADQGGGLLEDTVRLVARELAAPQLASQLVLDRLVDILLVQVIREWLAGDPPEARASWLGALRDPVVGGAVALLHADPARPWTTDTLAAEVAVSRATLARRFATVTGEAPGAYLTRWRMDIAARRLRDTDEPLAQVAAEVGYTSVYAFSRAFSRTRATPPGRFRIESRKGQADTHRP